MNFKKIYLYGKVDKDISKKYNPTILKKSDICIDLLKTIDILIINEKDDDKLFQMTKKLKIVVFTSVHKYKNDPYFIYYDNINALLNYLNILNKNCKKTFTVLIPIYNSYEYLDKCIGSVFDQTFTNFVIFICDDNSNLKDFIDCKNKYENNENIFIFKNSSNLGKFLTLNNVLRKIKTDYFLVLDSDDKLIKNRLIYDLINLNCENHNVECVQSKYVRFDVDKKNIVEYYHGHNSITFKSNIINKIGYYCPNRFGGDSEYIMRIKKIIGKKAVLRYNVITYVARTRKNGTNLTKIYDDEKRKIYVNKIYEIYENINDAKIFLNKDLDYFADLVKYNDSKILDVEMYKTFYIDIKNLSNSELSKHWDVIGKNEGRLPNLNLFKSTYPNFDWKLYVDKNSQKYLTNEYEVYGWVYLKNKENYFQWLKTNNYVGSSEVLNNKIMTKTTFVVDNNAIELEQFIKKNNIKYIWVSSALAHFEKIICDKFNLIKYNKLCDKFENVIFFGLYTKLDYLTLTNHFGCKYLMWGGTDSNYKYDFRKENLEKIKNYLDIVNLAISNDIYNSLCNFGIEPIKIYLNMVDTNLFKPIENCGECIYIYNGFTKGNEDIYGKSIYEEVMKKLPEYKYILSNELNLEHSQMPQIYSQCFIGLRLTTFDGNANTVQEFNSMQIPIIFNGDGGIKWIDVDDIINTIISHSKNKKIYNNIIDMNIENNFDVSEINEHDETQNNIVIIHGDIDLNNTDGCAIWLTNLINTLNQESKQIIYLNTYKINNDNFIRNIEKYDMIKIIDCTNVPGVKLCIENLYLDINNKIENIIVRSKKFLENIDENWILLNKLTIYALDIHLDNVKNLNNKYKELWTQSEKLKELFVSNGIEDEKIKLTPPMAWKYNFDLPKRTDEEIRLIYVGTLRDEENILEIIDEFKKIHQTRPEVLLKIIYGKIHGNAEFISQINQIIAEGVDGIVFKHNLSHKNACYEIATSDIGICWRKNGWGENGEVSTKEKEYEMYGLIIENDFKENLKKSNFIISDEFTHAQFNINNAYYYLSYIKNKTKYKTMVKYIKPSMLFVDSFWKGCDRSWSNLNEDIKFKNIQYIVELCKENNIETVFWNKEDPISFNVWINYALLFDKVYTTDIDCIEIYKSYGIVNIFLLPFLSNSRINKLLKTNHPNNNDNTILFAGSWYEKYVHRCDILKNILEKHKNNLVIYDRNYNGIVNNDKRYIYPKEFSSVINPNIDIFTLSEYYKKFNYILNLNSVTESYSMCARRIFEIINSGGYPISNYSNSIDIIYSGYLHYLDDSCEVKKKNLKKFFCCIIHTLKNYLQDNLNNNLQITENKTNESIAVIYFENSCLNINNIGKYIECYLHQEYEYKTLYFISNNTIFKLNNNDNSFAKTTHITEKYFAIFSESIFYAKKYLTNFMIFYFHFNKHYNNVIVTKIINEENLNNNLNWFTPLNYINIHGCILNTKEFNFTCLKDIADKINKFIDGKKIIQLDPYNMYYNNDEKFSTEIQENNFTGISINYLTNLNNNLGVNLKKNNYLNDIIFSIKPMGKYNSNSHNYSKPIRKIFDSNGFIKYTSTNNILLYYKNITNNTSDFLSPNSILNINKNDMYEFKWRFKSGDYDYLIKEQDASNEKIIINRSLIVITNVYPSLNNLYKNGFIHSRNILYNEYLSIVVICLSPIYNFKRYIYDNIVVYCMNKDFFLKIIFINLNKISIHFLDDYIYECVFLNNKFNAISKNIFIHGSEIQPSKRRTFDINYIENGEIKDYKKKILWNNVTTHKNIRYIFVSKYFYNEVCEDYGRIFSNAEIIHNPVDLNNFNYEPKNILQRKKILLIRSFASTKYANDLSINCIIELSKKCFFNELEFSIYGDGILFNELTNKLKIFKNVNINNKFLNHCEISKIHKNYGIFLCPTRMDSQGCSMCEAMSSGLVPITNNITAIPEFMDDECGFLCKPENYIEMADSIEKLYNDPELFQKMSFNANKRIREQLNIKNIIEKELN